MKCYNAIINVIIFIVVRLTIKDLYTQMKKVLKSNVMSLKLKESHVKSD